MTPFITFIIPILTPRESLECVLKSIDKAVERVRIVSNVLVVSCDRETTSQSMTHDLSLQSSLNITDIVLKQGTQAFVLNQALNSAQGEWVMILCPDSILDEMMFSNFLEQLLLNRYDAISFNHTYDLSGVDYPGLDLTHDFVRDQFKMCPSYHLFNNVNGIIMRRSTITHHQITFNSQLDEVLQVQDCLMNLFIHSRRWLLTSHPNVTLNQMHYPLNEQHAESLSLFFETKMLLMHTIGLDLKHIHDEVWEFVQSLQEHVFKEHQHASFKQKCSSLKSYLDYHAISLTMIESFLFPFILKRPLKLAQWLMLLYCLQEGKSS